MDVLLDKESAANKLSQARAEFDQTVVVSVSQSLRVPMMSSTWLLSFPTLALKSPISHTMPELLFIKSFLKENNF